MACEGKDRQGPVHRAATADGLPHAEPDPDTEVEQQDCPSEKQRRRQPIGDQGRDRLAVLDGRP